MYEAVVLKPMRALDISVRVPEGDEVFRLGPTERVMVWCRMGGGEG